MDDNSRTRVLSDDISAAMKTAESELEVDLELGAAAMGLDDDKTGGGMEHSRFSYEQNDREEKGNRMENDDTGVGMGEAKATTRVSAEAMDVVVDGDVEASSAIDVMEGFEVVVRDLVTASESKTSDHEPIATHQVAVCQYCRLAEFEYPSKMAAMKQHAAACQGVGRGAGDVEEVREVDVEEEAVAEEVDEDDAVEMPASSAVSQDTRQAQTLESASPDDVKEVDAHVVSSGGDDIGEATKDPNQLPVLGEEDGAVSTEENPAARDEVAKVSTSAAEGDGSDGSGELIQLTSNGGSKHETITTKDRDENMEIHEPVAADRSPTKTTASLLPRTPLHRHKLEITKIFRVFIASPDNQRHAECRYCGKQYVYHLRMLTSHALHCMKRPRIGGDTNDDHIGDDGDTTGKTQGQSKPAQTKTRGRKCRTLQLASPTGHDEDKDKAVKGEPRRSKRLKRENKPVAHDHSVANVKMETNEEETEVSPTKKLRGPRRSKGGENAETPLSKTESGVLDCTHCLQKISTQNGSPALHLATCPELLSRLEQSSASAVGRLMKKQDEMPSDASDVVDVKQDKPLDCHDSKTRLSSTLDELLSSAAVKSKAPKEYELSQKLHWLFGSQKNTERIRQHDQHDPIRVHGDVNRFHSMIVDELHELNIQQLASEVAARSKTTVIVEGVSHGHVRHMTELPISSAQDALRFYQCGFGVKMPASEQVTAMLVPSLASEWGALGPFSTVASHSVSIVCGGAKHLLMDWRMEQGHSFMICLKGDALWQLRCGDNTDHPVNRFYPFTKNRNEADEHLKIVRATERTGALATRLPYIKAEDDLGDMVMGDPGQQYPDLFTHPGDVVYIPAGIWYSVEATRLDTSMTHRPLWLHIELHTKSYGDLVGEATQQLLWSEPLWREPIQMPHGIGTTEKSESSDSVTIRKQIKHIRQRMAEVLQGLVDKLDKLEAADVIPELLISSDLGLAHDVDCDESTGVVRRTFEFDLTRKPHHSLVNIGASIKILKGSMFRVNPLAVLMSESELPNTGAFDAVTGTAATSSPSKVASSKAPLVPAASSPPHQAKPTSPRVTGKKALARRAKQKASLPNPLQVRGSSHSQTGAKRGAYRLHVLFGNDQFQPRLRVMFQCDDLQCAVIEWIRSREDPTKNAFHISELSKAALASQKKYGRRRGVDSGDGPSAADEAALRYILRFLCGTGYLTHVKVPF